MSLRLRSDSLAYCAFVKALLASRSRASESVEALASKIVGMVKLHGDKAVLAYNRKFDGASFKRLRLRVSCLPNSLSIRELFNLKLAYDRIVAYHIHQLPTASFFRDSSGVRLGSKWTPLARVAVYVPGGTAGYFSSIMMNAIPAKLAGVKRISLITPYYRLANPALADACAKLCGLDYIYCSGGAQAIAAIALGTRAVFKVDKITGPGDVYVAAAKKVLFGTVGSDCATGPSETVLVVDHTVDKWTASVDLVSQLERDRFAMAVLVTKSARIASEIRFKTAQCVEAVARNQTARYSWSASGVSVICKTSWDLRRFIEACAPKHLQVQTARPALALATVNNAGAVFLGKHTPVSVGDYVLGTNHTLPTAAAFKFGLGLSVLDYVKRTSVTWITSASVLKPLASACVHAALVEGLRAHALAVICRLAPEPKLNGVGIGRDGRRSSLLS
ncbi:MAG: histidinol dehydrogenase [Candidatus Hodgkinia cicadicola]|nr:MAG: histidinol dehydrogenase [Candidatus Hodgkinia cicadicola]